MDGSRFSSTKGHGSSPWGIMLDSGYIIAIYGTREKALAAKAKA